MRARARLAAISNGPAATQPATGTLACVEIGSITRLFDGLLSVDPASLPTLLAIVWQTEYKLEARTILRAAVACRDPLSDLHSLFSDAVSTMTDLEKLSRCRRHWQRPEQVVGRRANACALLNAWEAEIGRGDDAKRRRLEAIRERLEKAAAVEKLRRGQEIRARTALRTARCPRLWETLDHLVTASELSASIRKTRAVRVLDL